MHNRLKTFFGFAACAAVMLAGTTGIRPALAADSDVTIGFAAASTGWPWYVSFIKSFNDGAAKHSWKTVVLSANGDVPTQLNQIRDLVAKKVNYLVVGPIDGSAVIPGLKAAKEGRRPVRDGDSRAR